MPNLGCVYTAPFLEKPVDTFPCEQLILISVHTDSYESEQTNTENENVSKGGKKQIRNVIVFV